MKSLGMWAMVCLAAFIIGKTAKTENKEVSDVVLENVEALANPEGNGNISWRTRMFWLGKCSM